MINDVSSKLKPLINNPRTALTTTAAVTLAGYATRQLIVNTWKAVNGEEPPRDPGRPDVDWGTAILWTSAVGLTVGLARLAVRRAMHSDRES